jgi:ribosomal protein S18 acetylase RimI-like enzyme
LDKANELVVRSINDLTVRQGFGQKAVLRPPTFHLFCLTDDPDGVWVAEGQGEIVGFASSWVCDDFWFLGYLFISPGQQGQGIGDTLLKRTLAQADKAGAKNKALITYAFNRASQGLYVRHGLFPRLPLYDVAIPRENLLAQSMPSTCVHVPIEDSSVHFHHLSQIDTQVLGFRREKHHRFLLAENSLRGRLFYAADECIGYGYVSSEGHVGPLAASRTENVGSIFTAMLHLAASGESSQVTAFLPGTADTALQIAVEHEMRITFPMVLMATCNFGDWARYLPRNPGFM